MYFVLDEREFEKVKKFFEAVNQNFFLYFILKNKNYLTN